jgi:CheY-like chemotaxis protein
MTAGITVTVLVANDNEPQNYALCRMLQQQGYQVLRAFNGRQALEEATKLPQMILLDVNMPDILGFQVCRLLKKDPATAKIPVVFITATYKYSFGHEQAKSAGGAGFLFYPVDSGQLAAVVEGALARGA